MGIQDSNRIQKNQLFVDVTFVNMADRGYKLTVKYI